MFPPPRRLGVSPKIFLAGLRPTAPRCHRELAQAPSTRIYCPMQKAWLQSPASRLKTASSTTVGADRPCEAVYPAMAERPSPYARSGRYARRFWRATDKDE